MQSHAASLTCAKMSCTQEIGVGNANNNKNNNNLPFGMFGRIVSGNARTVMQMNCLLTKSVTRCMLHKHCTIILTNCKTNWQSGGTGKKYNK